MKMQLPSEDDNNGPEEQQLKIVEESCNMGDSSFFDATCQDAALYSASCEEPTSAAKTNSYLSLASSMILNNNTESPKLPSRQKKKNRDGSQSMGPGKS